MYINSFSPHNNAIVRWRLESSLPLRLTSEETEVRRGGYFPKVTHCELESGFSSGRMIILRVWGWQFSHGTNQPSRRELEMLALLRILPWKQLSQIALRKSHGPPAAPLCLELMAYSVSPLKHMQTAKDHQIYEGNLWWKRKRERREGGEKEKKKRGREEEMDNRRNRLCREMETLFYFLKDFIYF